MPTVTPLHVIREPQTPYTGAGYDRPNIFIVGASGSGKSTSLLNLDPATTVIINTERKTLPFRHAGKFKKQVSPADWEHFMDTLVRALDSDNSVVVIESFTAAIDLLYQHVIRFAADTRDAYMVFRDEITDLFALCKRSDKFVVYIALQEQVQDDQMRMIKSVSVPGAWKGKCESQAEIVVFTHVSMDHEHQFITNAEPRCTAKSPMGMCPRVMPNDLASLLALCDAYYLDESPAQPAAERTTRSTPKPTTQPNTEAMPA